MKVRVIDIGNSKGIRLSQTLIKQYNITEEVSIELKKDGILLKPSSDIRDGWEEKFKKESGKVGEDKEIDNKFDEEEWTW